MTKEQKAVIAAAMRSYKLATTLSGDEYKRIENELMLKLWDACARLSRKAKA